MTAYLLDKNYTKIHYNVDDLNHQEFESCVFESCDFSDCNFIAVTFIDCTFNHCTFDNSQINHVALRTVYFNYCKISAVNFAMCDKLIFEIHFKNCVLDFSKFYTLKMKATTFKDCSLVAVDFMNTDLTDVIFENCDLTRVTFESSILEHVNFKTAYNFELNPRSNRIKKAIFSNENIAGLLTTFDIKIE